MRHVYYEHFNSIKVRLKHNSFGIDPHNFKYFNSIKVRLKLAVPSPLNVEENDFNSIKVRLKPKQKSDTLYQLQTFQFHKGTIKTHPVRRVHDWSDISIP